MSDKSMREEIISDVAWLADDMIRIFHKLSKASPESFHSMEVYENTFISEYAAIEFLGLIGYDYKEFENILKLYRIETFTISPGNIRVYRKSQIVEARRSEIHTDSWTNKLKEIRAKNCNQSDITRKIGELLNNTGITQSGE
jgi:hypothetical protein